MSDLAQSFLDRWTEENVTAIPAADHVAEAERLSTACREEAAQEGITEEELDEACAQSSDDEYSDLQSFMQAALEASAAAAEDEDAIDDEDDN
jgi:hypothetical protein